MREPRNAGKLSACANSGYQALSFEWEGPGYKANSGMCQGSLPNPFPIPKFHPNTEKKIQDKTLIDADRKYVVQTLATVMMTHVQRPSLQQCGIVGKALVNKYAFLKDDEGDGEVS